jgi:hypothetical protein
MYRDSEVANQSALMLFLVIGLLVLLLRSLTQQLNNLPHAAASEEGGRM